MLVELVLHNLVISQLFGFASVKDSVNCGDMYANAETQSDIVIKLVHTFSHYSNAARV